MNLKSCPFGHYYDSDKFSVCPHCKNSASPFDSDYNKVKPPVSSADNGDIGLTDAIDDAREQQYGAADGEGENKTVRYFDSVSADPVAGWLVCIEGEKNFGKDFRIRAGRNFIGRSEEDICIAGDASVSRHRHASVIYDPKNNVFIIEAGESRGLTYLNNEVVVTPSKLKSNDIIQVGNTRLLFIPCCTESFRWEDVIPDKKSSTKQN